MAKINELLDQGYTNRATNALYDSLYNLLQTKVPGARMTRAEFDYLMPLLVKKIEEPEEAEKTPEPGDDIELVPSACKLIVTFKGPEDVEVPPTYVHTYAVGYDYEYDVLPIEGYVPTFPKIVGKMPAHDVHVEIEYTPVPDPEDVKEAPEFARNILPKPDCKDNGSSRGYTDTTDPDLYKIILAGSYPKGKYYGKNTQIEIPGTDGDGPYKEGDKPAFVIKPVKDVWYPGICIHSLKGITKDNWPNIRARYYDETKGEWINFSLEELVPSKEKAILENGDSANESQGFLQFPITINDMRYPNGQDGNYHQYMEIDWNQDGYFCQHVDIQVQCDSIYLYDKAGKEQLWPEE